MVQITRSRKKNCAAPDCTLHYGRRKLGPHMRCELVIPKPGDVQAAVYRVWDDAGVRLAYLITFDGQVWSDRQPLPDEPGEVLAGAVSRAEEFLRAGVL